MVRRVELKKFAVGSVFKVIMYMMIIPIALFFMIGIVTTLIGVATQAYELVGIGIFIGIGYPIIFLLMYGLFGTLMALIYNAFAGRFGGLELTISEIEENTNTQVTIADNNN